MPYDLPRLYVVYQQMQRWMRARYFETMVEEPRLVSKLAVAVQQITGDDVELAYVDQGYTGDSATQAGGPTRHTIESSQTQ